MSKDTFDRRKGNESIIKQSSGEQTTLSQFTGQQIMTDGGSDINSLTPSIRKFLKLDRNNRCEACGAQEEDNVTLEIHHKKPRSEGGTHHPENLKLLCKDCHYNTHNGDDTNACRILSTPTSENFTEAEPLPPHSDPSDTDKEIIAVIEKYGPVSATRIADETGYSAQHIRRHLWKLAGEKLIVKTASGSWEVFEKASEIQVDTGLPDTPKSARKAGRDEIIRRMAAHGMSRSEIIDITGLSRSTVDIGINRARARAAIEDDDEEIDLEKIATQLTSIVRMIDSVQVSE